MGKNHSKNMRKAGQWMKATFYKLFGMVFRAVKDILPLLSGKFPLLTAFHQGDLYQLIEPKEKKVLAEDTLEKVQFVMPDSMDIQDDLFIGEMGDFEMSDDSNEFSCDSILRRYAPSADTMSLVPMQEA